jgi:hypothetical protein
MDIGIVVFVVLVLGIMTILPVNDRVEDEQDVSLGLDDASAGQALADRAARLIDMDDGLSDAGLIAVTSSSVRVGRSSAKQWLRKWGVAGWFPAKDRALVHGAELHTGLQKVVIVPTISDVAAS